MFLNIVNLFFITYTIMLFVKIIGSWFPRLSDTLVMRFVNYYTNPYLNIFRKFIPPIGGALDLSPLLAFFTLKLLQSFFITIFS